MPVRRRSFRMLLFMLAGWTFGGILMHVFRPDRINEGMLLGLVLGLLCHVVDILWKALGCYEARNSGSPCAQCPSRGRWARLCANHRVTACFLAFWFTGFLFVLGHIAFAVLGLSMLEFMDHGLGFISWLAGLLAAGLEAAYRFFRRA